MNRRIIRLVGPIALAVTVTDCATKRAVEHALIPGVPHHILGDFLRFTLTYNRVGAMGISLGDWSRPVFAACALAILLTLPRWYQHLSDKSRGAIAGLALVAGGAIGNLWDRVLVHEGVVDFIDIGIAQHRFFIFNVADIAVTIGTCLIALTTVKSASIERTG
jgi:signal peptidase II